MTFVRKNCAALFARTASVVLYLAGWKRATVYANLRHVSAVNPPVGDRTADARAFYRDLLRNLARHAGELLFCFNTFKKLPSETSAYPCRTDGWDFDLAEGAAPVLEKMRAGGIFLTAHYGNYEAIGPWLRRLQIPLVASYIPVRPAWLNRILDRKIRAVDGRPYGVDARTPREFLRLLDSNKLFCLLADQDSRIASAQDGMFAGLPVRNNPIPDFLLKHRPETPVFICWLDDSGSRRILHAVEIPRAVIQKSESDSLSIMLAFNRWLEARVKENPALWYGWTHRRFYSKNPEIYLG